MLEIDGGARTGTAGLEILPTSTMPNAANQILSELEAGRTVVNTARLLTQVVLQTLIAM